MRDVLILWSSKLVRQVQSQLGLTFILYILLAVVSMHYRVPGACSFDGRNGSNSGQTPDTRMDRLNGTLQ
jgi:hypothetical protein